MCPAFCQSDITANRPPLGCVGSWLRNARCFHAFTVIVGIISHSLPYYGDERVILGTTTAKNLFMESRHGRDWTWCLENNQIHQSPKSLHTLPLCEVLKLYKRFQ